MDPEDEELIPTRRSLLSRLKNWDDQASWSEFFETYWKLIYRTSIKAGLNDAEAQDVVQETMCSVMKSMPSFKYDPQKGSFKSWLLQLTSWRIRDAFRNRQPDVAMLKDAPSGSYGVESLVDPGGIALENVWEREWETHVFERAVNRVKKRVDPQQYQLYYLYVVKKWPVGRVARSLKVSAAKVYLAKHRVGRMIKEEIERLGPLDS